MGLGRLVRGAARRAAIAPLRVLGAAARVQVLEELTEQATVDAPIAGGAIRFHAPTPLLRARAAQLLIKEPDTIAWLDQLQADDVLWDVGANVGAFSLYAAARARCAVMAFEPSAANYFVLTRNVQLNGLSNITALCVALSGATGLGVLNLDSPAMGSAMSQFGGAGETSRYSRRSQPCTHGMIGFTMDDFIARFAPPFPTHLKLDVDGLEWPILQGARLLLADRRLRSAMIELSVTHGSEREGAIAFLQAAGLRLVAQGAPQGAGGEQAANHLFARQP